jgi:hypothetical protein
MADEPKAADRIRIPITERKTPAQKGGARRRIPAGHLSPKRDARTYSKLVFRGDLLPEEESQAQISRAFKNIELARQRMANDQIEIDRLRTETRALIAELLT